MALSTDIVVPEVAGDDVSARAAPGPQATLTGSRLSVRLRYVILLLIGLLSLAGYVAVWQVSDVNREPQAYIAYVALFAVLFALYLFACYLVLSSGRALPLRPTLALIGIVALAGRALLLPAPPTLSNDVYRYVWDGRVMAAGISPYQYPPGAPQLQEIRSADFDLSVWQHINRKNAITIYPAGAEMFYAGVYALAPDSVTAMKAAMVLVDLASCVVLALLLGALRMPPTRAIVYAWSPLPIIEFGSSGHVEALSVLLTLLALLAGVLSVRRYGAGDRRKPTATSLLAAVFLGAAMLVKLIPALLLAGWFRSFGWRFAALSIALFGAVSLAFIAVGGGYISPFLITYLRDEESNAPLFSLLRHGIATPLGLPDEGVRLLLGGALLLFAAYVAVRRERGPYDFIGKSFLLVGAYLALATSAHPWYATWLLLFVPLFLPPNGLPLFGGQTAVGSRPDLRIAQEPAGGNERLRINGGYSLAIVAIAYTGLTFLGYLASALLGPFVHGP